MYVSAPKPVCVEGFPGMPASTMLGSPKFGWLKTLKNWASHTAASHARSTETILSDRSHSRGNRDRAGHCGRGFQTGNAAGRRRRTHCPVLGSTAETKASGLSHWIVPGCVTPGWDDAHRAGRRERHWRTAARCPAQCRFRLRNRACSALRTELRYAKTWFQKSAIH